MFDLRAITSGSVNPGTDLKYCLTNSTRLASEPVSYTHLTLPTIYSV